MKFAPERECGNQRRLPWGGNIRRHVSRPAIPLVLRLCDGKCTVIHEVAAATEGPHSRSYASALHKGHTPATRGLFVWPKPAVARSLSVCALRDDSDCARKS